MRTIPVPCHGCNTPTRNNNSHCTPCNLTRTGTTTGAPTYAETQRRRTITQQAGTHCPGYQTNPHPYTTDSPPTADHLQPRHKHGDTGPLHPLCLQCNTRRQHGR